MSWFVGLPVVGATFFVALVLTRMARDYASRRHLLDHPGDRSAHAVPTPRLGGVALMGSFLIASAGIAAHAGATSLLVVLGATAVISFLGLIDDLRPLPARVRFAVQLVMASVVVFSRGPALLPALAPFDTLLPYPVLAAATVLWITWATNLYNFMDGIDGLAGGQAVWACAGLAVAAFTVNDPPVGWALLLLAASAAGFLRYNLPRASIFMGDAGSTAIGFFLASVPLASSGRPVPVLAVGLALSMFVLDATTTLVRRIVRRERFFAPHRTHLYQRPLALGASHGAVTYTAYVPMAVVAAFTGGYPSVDNSVRVGMSLIAFALFLVAWIAVRRLERHQRVAQVAEQS